MTKTVFRTSGSALQRQLNYPEVPRVRPRDDLEAKLEVLQARLRETEMRLKLVESEVRGHVDLAQFGRPELLSGGPEIKLGGVDEGERDG